jgi:hypothetical protein
MTTLTKPQTDLLTMIAADENGAVPPEGADRRVAAALIKRGLCLSIPQSEGPSRLLATQAGRAALEPSAAPASEPADEPDDAASAPDESAAAAPPPKAPKPQSGKLGAMVTLLERPEGAGLPELMAATGWQAHSVRGAMSGALKKKAGLTITSEKTEAGRVYRIVADAAA